ncbi:DUF6174 domain-containing protein [Streptomyces sp. NPDC052023]|uniref:DUF6174 domain-containing protein n=1 Tax=Streptomyces sp. NPDC052023 TaxID=3365681 RepID=UPI0037D1DDE4
MTSARLGNRAVFVPLALTGLMCAAAACGTGTSTKATTGEVAWEEPSSYTYTLLSAQGERSLIGTFRVTVRDGEVATAAGLDDSGRRVVQRSPEEVPAIGELLEQLEEARQDDADTAEAQYAADGRPERITLDWDGRAIDDEAVYVISAYRPAGEEERG